MAISIIFVARIIDYKYIFNDAPCILLQGVVLNIVKYTSYYSCKGYCMK